MRRPPDWVWSLIAVFIMRTCVSLNFNAIRNIKNTEYIWNPEKKICTYERQSKGEFYSFQSPFFIAEFFLPALGGLAVDKWFGELKMLHATGMLLLLSALYVTAMEMGQFTCRPVIYILGLIPGSLAYGVGLAPLAAVPQKLTHGHLGSPTPGLISYYFSAALGELIGSLPQYARPTVDVTWVVCASALLYIVACAALRLDWTEYQQRFNQQLESGFLFPTRVRLLRYFVLLAPLILMVSVLENVRGITYCLELNYYLNCSRNCTDVTCMEVFSGYNISTMLSMLLLGALYKAGCLTREGRINARFYPGAIILMLSKAALVPWHFWAAAQSQQPDRLLTHIVYGTAASLDGLANGLAMASGYELIYRIAPAYSKSLIMGFLFTTWGVGAGVSAVTLLPLSLFPTEHPILKPSFGESNMLYILYVVMSIEMALTLVYYRFVSARLASAMIVTDDDLETDEESAGNSSSDQRQVNSTNSGYEYNANESSAFPT